MMQERDGAVSTVAGQVFATGTETPEISTQKEKIFTWLKSRGISTEAAIRLSIGSAEHRNLGRCVTFPYMLGAVKVGTKFRNAKKEWSQEGNCAQTFFNSDCLNDASLNDLPLLITEGEIDCATLIECGFDRVIGFGAGAPPSLGRWPVTDEEDNRYRAIYNHKKQLDAVQKIILLTDSDEPGRYLNIDLRRRLGVYRCWSVIYPDDCKDINDVLIKHGKNAVHEVIKKAQPCPISNVKKLDDFTELEEPETFDTGWPWLDDNLKLFKPELMVVTGVPSHGKALALDTEIPTPSGWTTMGDIRVGDYVFDANGEPTVVEWISLVHENRVCYKIYFDNGEEVVADADHDWMVRQYTNQQKDLVKKSTQDLWDADEAEDGMCDWLVPGISLTSGAQFFTRITGMLKIESVPVRCIGVQSETHEFLVTRSFIRTHNSSWTNALICNLGKRHNMKFAVSSFEMPVKPYFRDSVRRYMSDMYSMTIAECDTFMNNHMTFIDPEEAGDEDYDLDWYLDRVNQIWLREGIDGFVIDPWNQLNHDFRKSGHFNYTDYICSALKQIKMFARRRDMIAIVVAHPSKMNDTPGKIRKPTLYDIENSAHWYNAADHGIVVWRIDDRGSFDVCTQKSRFSAFAGKVGDSKFQIRFLPGLKPGAFSERIEEEPIPEYNYYD